MYSSNVCMYSSNVCFVTHLSGGQCILVPVSCKLMFEKCIKCSMFNVNEKVIHTNVECFTSMGNEWMGSDSYVTDMSDLQMHNVQGNEYNYMNCFTQFLSNKDEFSIWNFCQFGVKIFSADLISWHTCLNFGWFVDLKLSQRIQNLVCLCVVTWFGLRELMINMCADFQ